MLFLHLPFTLFRYTHHSKTFSPEILHLLHHDPLLYCIVIRLSLVPSHAPSCPPQ